MLSRSSVSEWWISGAAHLLLLGAFAVAWKLTPRVSAPETVAMEILDKPRVAPQLPFATQKPKDAPPPKSRAVFGQSRRAITIEGAPAAVKPGNTIAKPQDDLTLKAEDADALPNPVDEFLVSEMPGVASEVRIPYPPEARAKGIEGPVVMDILIDDKGTVREAKLLSGPGAGLNEAALEAVKRFRFRPAKMDGNPVAVRIRYAYRFVLEK